MESVSFRSLSNRWAGQLWFSQRAYRDGTIITWIMTTRRGCRANHLSLENPYAPPVRPIEAISQPASDFPLSNWDILIRGCICSLIGGGCVFFYQAFLPFGRNNSLPNLSFSASFGVSALVILIAFGVYGFQDQNKRTRNIIATAILSPLALAGMSIAHHSIRIIGGPAEIAVALVLLWFSQFVMVIAVLQMRNVPVHIARVFGFSILATGLWLTLTFVMVSAVVRHLSGPLDDYVGYTSLTVFWIWTVVAQFPLAVSARSANAVAKENDPSPH